MRIRCSMVLAIALIACGDNSEPSGPSGIFVGASSVQLEVGQVKKIDARYANSVAEVDESDIQWSTSDSTKVSITGTGASVMIRGVATGAATITASGHGVTGTVAVTVVPASLVAIAIEPPQPMLAAGTTRSIAVVATYSDSSTAAVTMQVTWSSDKPEIATAAGGVLSGVARGEATLTATLQGKFSSTRVTVTPAALVSIDLAPLDATVSLGTPQQYTATGHFTDGSTQDITSSVTWSSSATGVATISAAGLATTVATGSTMIRATQGTITAMTMLTVTSAVLVSIAITPNDPDVPLSGDRQMTAMGRFSDATMADVSGMATWMSSDQAVATVAPGGLVSSFATGSTTITAGVGAISDTTQVSVFLPPVGPWLAEPGFPANLACADGARFAMASDAVYACTVSSGMTKGTITGTTIAWATANTGITNLAGLSLATHTQSPATVMYMGAPSDGVANWFRSGDGGATWTAFTLNDSVGDPRHIYAGRFQSTIGNILGTWDPAGPRAQVLVGMNPPTNARAIATATGTVRSITGSSATNLYVGVLGETPTRGPATGGVFRSTNNAMTWTAADGGIAAADKDRVVSIAIDPVDANVLYAGLRGGGRLYKTTNAGTSWSASAMGLPGRARVAQVLVGTPSTTIFAATDIGLYRSVDAGATWALAGFQGRPILSVAQSGAVATLILVAVDDAVGLYRAM